MISASHTSAQRADTSEAHALEIAHSRKWGAPRTTAKVHFLCCLHAPACARFCRCHMLHLLFHQGQLCCLGKCSSMHWVPAIQYHCLFASCMRLVQLTSCCMRVCSVDVCVMQCRSGTSSGAAAGRPRSWTKLRASHRSWRPASATTAGAGRSCCTTSSTGSWWHSPCFEEGWGCWGFA